MKARHLWLGLPLLPVLLLVLVSPFSCSRDEAWQGVSYGHLLWQHQDGSKFYLLPEVVFTLPPEDGVTRLEICRAPWVDANQPLVLEVMVDGENRFRGDLAADAPILLPIEPSASEVKIVSDGILRHLITPAPDVASRLTMIGLRVGTESAWLAPERWRLRRIQFSEDSR